MFESDESSDEEKCPRRGQKQCDGCEKWYNNRVLPLNCTTVLEDSKLCNEYLGGKWEKKIKPDAYKVSENLFSVIENKCGPLKRVFVNKENNFCESKKCSDKRANLINSGGDVKSFSCEHLEKIQIVSLPTVTSIKLSNVKNVITPKAFESLSKFAKNDQLLVQNIGSYKVIDRLSDKTWDKPFPLCHVKNEKCSLQGCTKAKRIHALAANNSKFCLHDLVICLANQNESTKGISQENLGGEISKENSGIVINKVNTGGGISTGETLGESSQEQVKPSIKLDYKSTSSNVLKDVIQHFPKMHEFEKQKEFLKLEAVNLNQVKSLETSKALLEDIKMCFQCGQMCEEYGHNKKTNSYLLTLGAIDIVKIPAYQCTSCNIIQYPKLAALGYVNVHNKLILSYRFLMDVFNLLVNGTAMIQCLESRITLLSETADLKLDARYIAVKVEKAAVALLSSLITEASLNFAICLLCGSFPKIISTDGEVKDSVAIRPNMVFEETDEPPPTLEEFLWTLQVQVYSMGSFQGVPPLTHNLLNLPKMIPPRLRGTQQNNESKKKSQFGDVDTSTVDLHELVVLVGKGDLDINNMDKYSGQELIDLAAKCDIDTETPPKKTGVVIKNMLVASYKRAFSGQSNCHKYVIDQKRTGGHQDAWCDHLFKVGSCFQARKESVSDPTDLVFSLRMPPVLHIHDDACTLVSHQFLTKPKLAARIYGIERRGCFATPNKDVPADASSTPDCEDILPLKYANRVFDVSAATDGGIRHPDTGSEDRWVCGHRLQKKSHKRNTCSYQDLDLTESGRMVKSLIQEGKQVIRKYKNVRQDRTRNFSTSYLFNYILDFSHNLTKFKKQAAELNYEGRDEISWRASKSAACGLADVVEIPGDDSPRADCSPKAKKAKQDLKK